MTTINTPWMVVRRAMHFVTPPDTSSQETVQVDTPWFYCDEEWKARQLADSLQARVQKTDPEVWFVAQKNPDYKAA